MFLASPANSAVIECDPRASAVVVKLLVPPPARVVPIVTPLSLMVTVPFGLELPGLPAWLTPLTTILMTAEAPTAVGLVGLDTAVVVPVMLTVSEMAAEVLVLLIVLPP